MMEPAIGMDSGELGLRYTGHFMVDIGLATMAAFAKKAAPEQLTEGDFASIADYMRHSYVVNPLRSFLTVVFPNSGFTQPAYNTQPEKRDVYSSHVLDAYAAEDLPERDVFLNLPVANSPYDVDGKLAPGRAYRQHIPLLTGEGVINFSPGGEPGLPISGAALLAVQALPLGCKKCMGRLLAVHSDDDEVLHDFASKFLAENLQHITLARQTGETKIPEPQQSPFTMLVRTLLDAQRERQQRLQDDDAPFSITAYHFSNSGQGPSLDIYHLPTQITAFLRAMQRAENRSDWQAIVGRAWQRETARKRKEGVEFVPRYNALYEDLFRLPEDARRFIRTYLLRIPQRYGQDKGDPRTGYSPREEAGLVSWKITTCFLKGVMNMSDPRIEEIRALGDRLAEYVSQQNDRAFFRGFFTSRKYHDLRNILIRASAASMRNGGRPLIEFDSYISVFEVGEELGRSDWSLARDLVLIRMIEQLHTLGWLRQHAEEIPEQTELQQETE